MSSIVSTSIPSGIPSQIASRSIGKKILMAITGFLSFGYVIGHMAGNLQIFIGQDQINMYAQALHDLGGILWVVRIGLIFIFGAHIWLGIQLKAENWSSRPENYKYKNTVKATLSSRTMIWTGITVFAFFTYHILHFTARITNPAYQHLVDSAGRFDAYSMIIKGFQDPLILLVYLVSMMLIAFHLSHGLESMFQSLGWSSPRYQPKLKLLANLVAICIFFGFTSIPLAVVAGFLRLPAGVN